MPIHESGRVEHNIVSGHINIVDGGKQVPAYSAHPRIGHKFAGVCLLHDWWGMNKTTRLLTNFFAQMGYYVIAPDLYGGHLAKSPKEAMTLLQRTENTRYGTVDAALSVLESHSRINRSVALVGIGIGGTHAFEAAIKRQDLEAAVAYGGFPQQYLGQFAASNTPILAIYGDAEPYIKPVVFNALAQELAATPLKEHHNVSIIPGAGHEFFRDDYDPNLKDIGKQVMTKTLAFLERYLEHPEERPPKPRF